jgi:DNA gyrase subunit B
VKDDLKLNEILFSSFTKNISLTNCKNETVTVESSGQVLQQISKLQSLVHKMSSKYDPEFLNFVIRNFQRFEQAITSSAAWEKQGHPLEKVLQEFKSYIDQNPQLGILTNNWEWSTNTSEPRVDLQTKRYSLEFNTRLTPRTVESSEWIDLRKITQGIFQAVKFPVCLKTAQQEEKLLEDPFSLYNNLLEQAKKGVYIQRYKGLGEMNPEQLWETTLNPNSRTLLKVTIDDAVAADETFSILMGEEVDPRKRFIQDHALSVKDLDI